MKEKLGHVVQFDVNVMLIQPLFCHGLTLHYCKRVGISLVKVYERVGKSVISVGKG